MNRFNFFVAFAVALIATTCAVPSYGQAEPAADYAHAAPGDAAVAPAADAGYGPAAPNGAYGQQYAQPSIPYSPQNTRGNTVTSSISYPHNKGEILIHRPAAIIVKRPPTKVLVNHPPLVVKPAPVVLHKPPAVVLRKVLVKHHPRPVKVEPVYVNVVKPPAEKYFVNEKQQYSAPPASYNPVSAPAAYSAGHESASASGYQLLNNNQGLAALAGLAGGNAGGYAAQAPGAYPGAAAPY